jgi:hypothetical protein
MYFVTQSKTELSLFTFAINIWGSRKMRNFMDALKLYKRKAEFDQEKEKSKKQLEKKWE